MFVTNWISTTKIQKISEITNFFRHYFLSRTEVDYEEAALYYLLFLLQEKEASRQRAGRRMPFPIIHLRDTST